MRLKMKINYLILTFVIICTMFQVGYSQDYKIHFLHHSTGRNLIDDGDIYSMFDNYNQQHDTNYIFTEEWSTPSGNYPYDYYSDTFSPTRLQQYVNQYDMIVFKHCFPGSDIREDTGNPDINSDRKSLENYKLQYKALRDRFDKYPEAKFLIMTIPPRHRLHSSATPERAARANGFGEWVQNEYLSENGSHPNIAVFDFRTLLIDSIGYLKYEYELFHNDDDCHPNELANQTICPLFFDAIIAFIHDLLPTPVELNTFSGKTTTNGILLTWITVTEKNNYGFEVQRKVNNESFEKIDFVKGMLTTTIRQEYEYFDAYHRSARLSYRLKQIDIDGTYSYSEIIELDYQPEESKLSFRNYPNPFNPTTTIEFESVEPISAELTIFNCLGEMVKSFPRTQYSTGFHKIQWDGRNDADHPVVSGLYFCNLQTDHSIRTIKMLLIR